MRPMARLKSVTRSTKLGPEERAAAIARLKEKELDILVVGGGIVGTGCRARRRDARALDRPARGTRLGVGHLEPVVEARARRHPLPRAARLPARARGAHRARPAAAAHRPAPREAGALPLPAEEARVRALLRRRRHAALRRLQLHRRSPAGRAAPPSPVEAAGDARHPVALAATRSSAASPTTTRRSTTPATSPSSPAPPRSTAPTSRAGCKVEGFVKVGERVVGVKAHDLRDRRALRDPREAGRERHRRVDRRHAAHGGRARHVQGARVEGHPPRRAARPHPVGDGHDLPHREERAVRHPVGPALADRHDRHRLEPRQGAPGGDRRRHRLPARARERGARGAAHP